MDAGIQELSSWERRRADISTRIEIIALELCLEQGIEATTVVDVARVAGISRRTFYRYFDTVDDVIFASPRRSLDRIIRNVRARPLNESIREAFVGAAHDIADTDEELRIKTLGTQISRKEPEALARVMGRIQPTVHKVYRDLVAERLKVSGHDTAMADVVAGVLIAAVGFVCHASPADRPFSPDPDLMDEVLRTVSEVMQ